MARVINTAKLTTATVREFDSAGTYTARRDIPALWVPKVGRLRRLMEWVKRWQYGEGR